jgi:multiple sugar transport system permease protein
MTNANKRKFMKLLHRIVVWFFTFLMAAPFLWTALISLKREEDVLKTPIQYIPNPIVFENFINAWKRNHFGIYFKNSFYIAIMAVLFISVLAIINGYVISRFKFKGKGIFSAILLSTQLLPVIVFIIPLYLTFKNLGILNTPYAIMIFYVAIQLPFNTLLMRSFIHAIPPSVDEAGMIDGVGRMGVIFRIIAPTVIPGIVATCSYAFIGCWNEFLVAFAFVSSKNNLTIPVGLQLLIAESNVDYSSLAAGGIIALIPPVILFAYLQKYMVQGLTAGAVKG